MSGAVINPASWSQRDYLAASATLIASLTPTQVAAIAHPDWLPLAAVAGFTANQMSSIAIPFGYFPAAWLNALSPAAFAAIPVSGIAAMSQSALAGLSAANAAALTTTQMAALPHVDWLGLTAVAALSPAQLGAIHFGYVWFTAAWLSALPGATFASISAANIANVNTTAIAGLAASQVEALTTKQLAALTTGQVAALTATEIGQMSDAQLAALPTPSRLAVATVHALTPAQLAAMNVDWKNVSATWLDALAPAAFASLSASDFALLGWSALSGLGAQQLAALTASDAGGLAIYWGGVSAAWLNGLSPAAVAGLSASGFQWLSTPTLNGLASGFMAALTTTEIAALTTGEVGALTPAQIGALTLPDLNAMSAKQVAALTASELGGLSATQSAGLSTAFLDSLKPPQLAGLGLAATEGLSLGQIASLGVSVSGLSAAGVAGLSTKVIGALSTWQVGALTDPEIAALTPHQIGALTAAEAAALSPAQIAALGAGVQSLSAAALQALSPLYVADDYLRLSTAEDRLLTTAQASVISAAQTETRLLKQLLHGDGLLGDAQAVLGANNSLFSYQGVLSMLKALQGQIGAQGLTADQFADLQALSNAVAFVDGGDSYVYGALNALVNGNAANTYWTGGQSASVALGNLKVGATATQLGELIGKWFLGTDLPSPGGTNTYVTDSNPLFSASGPLSTDPQQYAINDCPFVAGLVTLAQDQPQALEAAITQVDSGVYAIHFLTSAGTPMWVTVDNQFATEQLSSASGDIWAQLLEKASILWVDEKWGPTNSYDAVPNSVGGITGKGDFNDYSSSLAVWDTTVAAKAIAALNAGEEVEFNSNTNDYDVKNGKQDLVAGHEFAVLGYDAANAAFILRNPWGAAEGSAGNGTFEQTIGQLWGGTATTSNGNGFFIATGASPIIATTKGLG